MPRIRTVVRLHQRAAPPRAAERPTSSVAAARRAGRAFGLFPASLRMAGAGCIAALGRVAETPAVAVVRLMAGSDARGLRAVPQTPTQQRRRSDAGSAGRTCRPAAGDCRGRRSRCRVGRADATPQPPLRLLAVVAVSSNTFRTDHSKTCRRVLPSRCRCHQPCRAAGTENETQRTPPDTWGHGADQPGTVLHQLAPGRCRCHQPRSVPRSWSGQRSTNAARLATASTTAPTR
jgi:hypothetical protein